MKLERIISGGQTGADRGGLEAAIALGIPHGGWCPLGRRAEDGRIPDRYALVEMAHAGYAERTRQNIMYSDGTIVFSRSMNTAGPGTRLTINFALEMHKPLMAVWYAGLGDKRPSTIRGWLKRHKIKVLNVAGSREASVPGIEEFVKARMIEVLR